MRSSNKSLFNFILSAVFTGGFVKHTHNPFDASAAPGSFDVDAKYIQPFDYPHAPIKYRNRILTKLETAHHRVRYIRFPSAGFTRQPDGLVRARFWQAKTPGRKRLVIVLPIYASYTYPTEKMAQTVRHHYRDDCHVLEIVANNYVIDWNGLAAVQSYAALLDKAEEMAESLRIAVIDLKRCIDWAVERDEVDADRIGVMGFSISGVLVALTLGLEPRIKAGVVLMGGAHPADIIANCDGKPGIAKAAILARLGLSEEEYYRIFETGSYGVDPVRFAGRYRPDRILLFDSLYDTCMPARSRTALWEAMGRPERYRMHYGHKSSFLAMTPLGRNFMRRKTLQFLDRML